MKNVLMLFFRSKKKKQKENPSFCTPKPTLIILTFFPSEWARGKMTIGNQWKLHAIVNNICIWFFVSILHDLLYWEMLNPAEWGRENEMSSMAAAVYASPQLSHTRFIFFTPKVPDPQQFDYCCFHSSSTGHGNSIQIGRFSPLIPFE